MTGTTDRRVGVRAPHVLIGTLCIGCIAFLISQLLLFRFGRDHGIYATIAVEMLHGQILYRDLWDFKTPGIYFIFVAAEAILGHGMAGIRVLESIGLIAGCAGIVLFTRLHIGSWIAGAAAAAIACFYYVRLEFWSTAQPEGFAGIAIIWAMLLAAVAARTQSVARLAGSTFAVGLLYGCATALKPHFAAAAAMSLVVVLLGCAKRDDRLKRSAVAVGSLAAGFAVPLAALLVYFVHNDALGSAREILFEWLPKYAGQSWQETSAWERISRPVIQWGYHFSGPYAGIAVMMLLFLPQVSPREREGVGHILAVVIVQLVGVAAQSKFFAYHYAGAVFLSSLLVTWGIWKGALLLSSKTTLSPESVFVAAFLFIVAVHAVIESGEPFQRRTATRMRAILETPSERYAILDSVARESDFAISDIRQAAHNIRRVTSSADSIYVWGTDPIIYYLSQRRPAVRYITNQAQRAAWSLEPARSDLIMELKRRRPAAIVVQRKDRLQTLFGNDRDSAAELAGFSELSQLLSERYQEAGTAGNFALYAR